MLSGLNELLKGNFHLIRSPPGDPRVAHCSHFSVRISPPIFFSFFPLTGISARGSQGRSDTALRLDSRLFALYETWFPGICLISEGKITKKSILLCPPSLIQRQITTHPVSEAGNAKYRRAATRTRGNKINAARRPNALLTCRLVLF